MPGKGTLLALCAFMLVSGATTGRARGWSHEYQAPEAAGPTPTPPAEAAVADTGETSDAAPTRRRKLAKPIDIRSPAIRAATVRETKIDARRTVARPKPVVAAAAKSAPETHVAPAVAAQIVAKPEVAILPVKPVTPVAALVEAVPAVVQATTAPILHIPLFDLISKHASENGVPVKLAAAVIQIESRYQASTIHAGNYGLMQIRAQTARGLGFSGPVRTLIDPETNLRLGMKYLGQAYRMAKGDLCYTVMRYQSGFGTNHLNAANRAYCAKAHLIMAQY